VCSSCSYLLGYDLCGENDLCAENVWFDDLDGSLLILNYFLRL
jgi:hypothetical protein